MTNKKLRAIKKLDTQRKHLKNDTRITKRKIKEYQLFF